MELLENIINAVQFIIDIIIDGVTSFLEFINNFITFIKDFVLQLPAPFSSAFIFIIGFALVFFIYKFVR